MLLKPLTFLLCLSPFCWIFWQIWLLSEGLPGSLGADPAEAVVHFTGQWAFIMLLATLSVSPIRKLSGVPTIGRIRRMLGLFAFAYAFAHLLSYVTFFLELQVSQVLVDVLKRPYITLGFLAFLMLIPLALTSNRYSIQRLKKNWQKLHQMVYGIALLGLAHFVWLTKSDFTEAVLYGLVLFLLLAYRLFLRRKRSLSGAV